MPAVGELQAIDQPHVVERPVEFAASVLRQSVWVVLQVSSLPQGVEDQRRLLQCVCAACPLYTRKAVSLQWYYCGEGATVCGCGADILF